jgi:hypothetical protein
VLDVLFFLLQVAALGFVAWGGILVLIAQLPKARRSRRTPSPSLSGSAAKHQRT